MSKAIFASLVVLSFAFVITAPVRAETLQSSTLRGAAGEPLCVDIAGGQAADGANLILYPCHGGGNQSFTYYQETGEIRSSLGNFCVDVAWGTPTAGNQVRLWTCNGLGAQGFDYDTRSGRFSYRLSSDLCLDLKTAGTSTLQSCNDRPSQSFDLQTRYGKSRFDELTFVASHNAFANNEDGNWTAVNQSHSLARQLDDGVRALLLDAHSFASGTARCIASLGMDCYPQDVYMCHGNCGGAPTVEFGLPRRTIADGMRTVVAFLRAHPEEIVTVFIEDLVAHDELAKSLAGVSGLKALQFDPYAWNVQRNGWPRASTLVQANARLLIISDRSDKTDLGVGYARDFTVENYWSLGTTPPDYSCKTRWSNVTLDRVEPSFQRLFLMNHYRDVPLPATASNDNARGTLLARIQGQCVPAARRKPNYIALDFYENGDARALTAEINDSVAILYEHNDFGGRAQLLRPGNYPLSALSIGNDAVSSLALAPGSRAVLFADDNFQGNSQSVVASMSGLPAFNDLTSSVQVFRDPADTLQNARLTGDFDGDGRSDLLVYYGGTSNWSLARGNAGPLAWSVASNTAGFGSLMDGRHTSFSGDFSGDGTSDVLMYFAGDGNLWLGQSSRAALSWSFAGNAASLGNLLDSSHALYDGDFDGNGKRDLLAYDQASGDLWLGLSNGAALSWSRAGNASALGPLLDDQHAVYQGDFDGNGKSDLAVYLASTGEVWLGLSDGAQLAFTRAASVSGFGNLIDLGHRMFVGDFDGNKKSDLAFYYAGNGDFFFGLSDGANINFANAGNVAGFGNLLEASRALRVGDFNGDGKSDLAFYFSGDGNLWLGRSDGVQLSWGWAGSINDFGNLLDLGRALMLGDYDGDGKTDLLAYSSNDRMFRIGRSNGAAFEWFDAGTSTLIGDLFR